MKPIKKIVFPLLLATLWVSLSEFTRNELLLKQEWTAHYQRMGLLFPSEPVNGLWWGIWSFCYSVFIFLIAQRFSWPKAAFLSWFAAFPMMWIVLGNLGVLPYGILPTAIPLSMLEAAVATLIVKKLS